MSDYIEGHDIQTVYDDHSARYAVSQRKQNAARDLLAGKMKAPLDESILPGSADRESLRSSIPEKFVVPIKTEAMIAEKKSRVKRFPVGIGQRAMATATKIEQIDNALVDQLYPEDVIIDNLLQEGAAICVTQPMTSFWAKAPDSMYEDPDNLTGIKKKYAVDKDGRSEDDDYYAEGNRKFRAHEKSSTKYFDSVRKDYYARNIPLEMRGMSCREAVVLYPRRKGDRMVVDGLVRKSEWSLSSLVKAGYSWGQDYHMEPGGAGATGDKQRTMYEYIGTNAKGHVYFSYSVDGEATFKNGKSAVIDLTEKWGIETLPVAFDYGMCFPGEIDADMRPIPFVDLFARSWMNQDSAITSLLVRFWKVANLYMTYQPDPLLLQHLGITGDVPMPEMRPGFIVPVLGKLQDVNSSVGLSEFTNVLAVLRSVTEEQTPSRDATGTGDSGVSGYGQNVALARALGTFTQVMKGRLSIKEQAVAHANEQMACIGRSKDARPVCMFVNQEIPVEQRSSEGQSSTRAIIEVDPDLFGDVWQVTAEVPASVEDNMALAQVLAEHHDRGKIPLRWVLEKGYGDPSPDITEAEIMAEAANKQPAGMAALLSRAATIAGDDEQAAIMEAMAAMELMKLNPMAQATADNVVPSSIGAGLQPPSHMTGMVAPNPVESQVDGIMGGEMNGTLGAREALP
jgi:hypothetical protein